MSDAQLIVQTGIYGYGILGDRAERDLDGTLDLIRAAGYDGVEVMTSLTADPRRLAAACGERGLSIAGYHLFWHELADPTHWTTAELLGTPRVILSGLPCDTVDAVAAALPVLRGFAATAHEHGMRLLLHNHAEECRSLGGGRNALEIVAAEIPAAELDFLIDLHWAAVGGDPDRVIDSIADRCDYYHVKDGLIGDPAVNRTFDLGTGEVDLIGAWGRILTRGPVQVAAVERHMPADPLEAGLHHDARFVRDLFRRTADRRG